MLCEREECRHQANLEVELRKDGYVLGILCLCYDCMYKFKEWGFLIKIREEL